MVYTLFLNPPARILPGGFFILKFENMGLKWGKAGFSLKRVQNTALVKTKRAGGGPFF